MFSFTCGDGDRPKANSLFTNKPTARVEHVTPICDENMSDEEESRTPKKQSILKYVENFIEKRDNELRTTDDEIPFQRGVDKESIVINRDSGDEFGRTNLVSSL